MSGPRDPENLLADYRHFAHLPTIAHNVGVTLNLNGRAPTLGDFERASAEDLTTVWLMLGAAKETWAFRYGVDSFDTWAVREELTRLRNREAAREMHARELAGDPSSFEELYLPRSAVASLERGEPLIAGVLDRHALIDVAGRDQSYKSFLVLDWLCCLASGLAWCGREVERTRGLYVVGEGAWGLEPRIAAWEAHHRVRVGDDWLTIRNAPANLFRGGPPLEELIRRVEAGGYGLVFFDTLRRCSAGANLNTEADAGMVITALDRVRDATAGGSAGYVAHTDKGDTDTRGSGTLEDDVDIVWRVKRPDEGGVRLSLTKRRDGPDGLSLALWPQPVAGSLVLSDRRPRE